MESSLLIAPHARRAHQTRRQRRRVSERGVAPMEVMDPGLYPQRPDLRGSHVFATWTASHGARWCWASRVARYAEHPAKPAKSIFLSAIAELARPTAWVDTVYTDQYDGLGLGAIAVWSLTLAFTSSRHLCGLRRGAACRILESLETWAAGGELDLPNDPQLRADLSVVCGESSRRTAYLVAGQTPDGRHADLARRRSLWPWPWRWEAASAPVVSSCRTSASRRKGAHSRSVVWEEQSTEAGRHGKVMWRLMDAIDRPNQSD